MPDDGLSVDIETSGSTIRPVDELAGDPRCRSRRAHHRGHRQCQPRPRHGRADVRAQAQHRQRRFRNAGYRTSSRRRRACVSASTARCRRRPSCWRATRCATASGSPLDPDASRGNIDARRSRSPCRSARTAARGRDELCDHRRPHQFRRRQADDGAEGRGRVAAGNRVERRLPGHRRRQDQRHAGEHRSAQAKGRRRRRIAHAGDARRSGSPPARRGPRQRGHRRHSRSG